MPYRATISKLTSGYWEFDLAYFDHRRPPFFNQNLGPLFKRSEGAGFCIRSCQLRHNQVLQSGNNGSARFSTRKENVRHFKIIPSHNRSERYEYGFGSRVLNFQNGAESKLLSMETVVLKPKTLSQ